MAMADDDDDSDNDRLYMDENPTDPDNQDSTHQDTNTQDVHINGSNNLPINSAEIPVDFLSLMKNVKVLENIPHLTQDLQNISIDQTVETKHKARITCKDFSRKAFDTNGMIEDSALYYHLTTDHANPKQGYTAPHGGDCNPYNVDLKQLLDAPCRPPPNPYVSIPTANTIRGANIRSQPQDPRTPPLANVPTGNQMLPTFQGASNQINQTSVIVAYPGNQAEGTRTLRPNSDSPNVPTSTSVNGCSVQNGLPTRRNSEPAQMYCQHAERHTQSYRETTTAYQGGMPNRTCELGCPCRKQGQLPHFFVSPEPTGKGRGKTKKPLVNSQPIKRGRGRPRKTATNPHPAGGAEPQQNPPQESIDSAVYPIPTNRSEILMDMPSLSPRPTLNQCITNGIVGPLDITPLNSQYQPNENLPSQLHSMNTGSSYNLNSSAGRPIDLPPFQSIISTNSNLHDVTGEPSDIPSSNRQQPSINPMNLQQHFINKSLMLQHQSMNISMIPQNHTFTLPPSNEERETMNTLSVNFQHQTGRPGDTMMPPFNLQHEFMKSITNHEYPGRSGGTINILPSNLQRQLMESTTNTTSHQYHGRSGGPMNIFPSNLQHQIKESRLNHQYNCTSGGPINISPLNFQHQIMQSTPNRQYDATSRGPMNVPSNFQHRTLESTPHQSNGVPGGPMNIPPLNFQSQTMESTPNHQYNGRSGGPMNIPPLNDQHQTMNPLNSQPMPRRPSCYQCAMGAPCEKRLATSYPNAPKPNSQTGSNYEMDYNKNGYTAQNPVYSDDQNKKNLASLRSMTYSENATRELPDTSFPADKTPKLFTTETIHANLAGIQYNQPIRNGNFTPSRLYPEPNWQAVMTQHTVTKKRAVKTTKTTKANKIPKNTNKIHEPVSVKQTTLRKMNKNYIPHIDITMDLTQSPSTSMSPNMMPVPLNAEAQKQTINMTIDIAHTNTTTTNYRHNNDTIDLMKVPVGEEVQPIPLTHFIENPTQQETPTNDINKAQAKEEQPWINIKSDGNQMPLIMDKQHMSMNNNVETIMQPCEFKATANTITKNPQSATFVQETSKDIDVGTAVAMMHANTNEQINVTQTSKTLVKSNNAYEFVSTTSVTTETTSQNMKSSNILKPETCNAEANTTVNVNEIIEKTLTVSFVQQVVTNPNISLPETDILLDILRKVQPNPIDTCSIIDQTENNKIENVSDGIYKRGEKDQTDEGIKIEDNNKNKTPEGERYIRTLGHGAKALPGREDEEKLRIARENLARLRLTKNNDASDDCNIKPGIKTEFNIEIKACPDRNCTALVQIPSFDGSSVKRNEYHIHCFTDNKTQIINEVNNDTNVFSKGGTNNETEQRMNEIDEPRKNTNFENTDVSESIIDEMIFFLFQIKFFKRQQNWLNVNNHKALANKLSYDILKLINLSNDANADLRYECHKCHNIYVYSPRQLYYCGNKEKALNCRRCTKDRSKYIKKLRKFVNNQITQSTEINSQRNVTAITSITERQTHLETARHSENDHGPSKQKRDAQLRPSVLPPFSNKTETCFLQNKMNNNTPDNQNQISNFVVKLPRNMLKESTVQALILRKNSKSNDTKSDGGEVSKIALNDNYSKFSSSYSAKGTTKDTVTSKISTPAVHVVKNISTPLADSIEKECTNRKSNRAENTLSKCPESKLINIKSSSPNTQKDCDKNQDQHSNKRQSSSETASGPNPNPPTTNRETNCSSKTVKTNDSNRDCQSKKKKRKLYESRVDTNPEPQKNNKTTETEILGQSNKKQENQSKKRKSIRSETAPVINLDSINTITISNNIDDTNKNQEMHTKKRKSVDVELKIATIPDALKQYSSTASVNNADNEKNKERRSKKRKSISYDTVPGNSLKPQSINTNNVSDNKEKNHERVSTKRKSISAQTTTEADLEQSKNTENILGIRKNISNEITVIVDKENCDENTTSINNNEHETRHSSGDEKSLDAATTYEKNKKQLYDNVSNKNSDNDTKITRPESENSPSTNISSQVLTVQRRQVTNTNKTNANTKLLSKNTVEKMIVSKNYICAKTVAKNPIEINTSILENIGARYQNRTEAYKKVLANYFVTPTPRVNYNNNNTGLILKFIKKLSIENNVLPEVKCIDKKTKKHEKQRKIYYRYDCRHCSLSFGSLRSCQTHVTDSHKKANIVPKDCIEMRKCDHCTYKYIKPELYNDHLKKHHIDIITKTIED